MLSRALALLTTFSLLLIADAHAAAGGGSSGFSGGGGGSGGSHGGSGGSGGGPLSLPILIICVVVGIVVLARLAIINQRRRRRRRERAVQVELAAAVASDDDPRFEPKRVRAAAAELFASVQAAWDTANREKLRRLVGPDLMAEWERRLDDFERKGWSNTVTLKGRPEVDYIGLVNREGEAEDRVCVWIECSIEDYVLTDDGATRFRDGETDKLVLLQEYWTLAPDGADGWIVVSIEQEAEGEHQLDVPIVATPDADGERLHDEATVEVAGADALPAGVAPGELVDPDYAADARKAALDLSLVDGRFAPAVLEAAVRQLARAWAEAVDGPDDALRRIATPGAVSGLLHRADGHQRVVVRGPRIEQLMIFQLDAEAKTMTVVATLRGRLYVEDRDTAELVAGDRERERRWTEHWILELTDDPELPWRLCDGETREPTRL